MRCVSPDQSPSAPKAPLYQPSSFHNPISGSGLTLCLAPALCLLEILGELAFEAENQVAYWDQQLKEQPNATRPQVELKKWKKSLKTNDDEYYKTIDTARFRFHPIIVNKYDLKFPVVTAS